MTSIDHAQGAGYEPQHCPVVLRLVSRAGYEFLLRPTTRAGERFITFFTATG